MSEVESFESVDLTGRVRPASAASRMSELSGGGTVYSEASQMSLESRQSFESTASSQAGLRVPKPVAVARTSFGTTKGPVLRRRPASASASFGGAGTRGSRVELWRSKPRSGTNLA